MVVDGFGILEIDRVPTWRDSKNTNEIEKEERFDLLVTQTSTHHT